MPGALPFCPTLRQPCLEPSHAGDPKPKPPPINAKAETVAKLPMFRDAYRRRRCILPIDAFFASGSLWWSLLGEQAYLQIQMAAPLRDGTHTILPDVALRQ